MVIARKSAQYLRRLLIHNGMPPELLKRFRSKKHFSHFDEELVIAKLLKTIPGKFKTNYVIDVAAADGVTMSNTYALYKSGQSGLAVEFDGELFARMAAVYKNFPKVNLARSKVTPENVVSLFDGFEVPKNFSVLNLDIDSYDFFVLEALLEKYRPALVCAEINEKIPPPLKFTVKYTPNHVWTTDHFFGQSVSKLHELCGKFEYDLVELHYNNAFLIPREANTNTALLPEEAYEKGYKAMPDRKEKFPYNVDMDPVLDMSPHQAKEFIDKAFQKYSGKYDLYI